MKFALKATAACVFSVLAMAPAAAYAITFDLTGTGEASSYEYTVDGVKLTVTPASFSDWTNMISAPGAGWMVTRNGNGMGIDRFDTRFGEGDPPELNGFNESLLFTFDKAVEFTSILFGEVDSNDDFDLFINGSITPGNEDINISDENPYLFLTGLIGTSIGIGADTLFGIFGGGDDFRVKEITVSLKDEGDGEAQLPSVPLPATLPMLGAGLALAYAFGRKGEARERLIPQQPRKKPAPRSGKPDAGRFFSGEAARP